VFLAYISLIYSLILGMGRGQLPGICDLMPVISNAKSQLSSQRLTTQYQLTEHLTTVATIQFCAIMRRGSHAMNAILFTKIF